MFFIPAISFGITGMINPHPITSTRTVTKTNPMAAFLDVCVVGIVAQNKINFPPPVYQFSVNRSQNAVKHHDKQGRLARYYFLNRIFPCVSDSNSSVWY